MSHFVSRQIGALLESSTSKVSTAKLRKRGLKPLERTPSGKDAGKKGSTDLDLTPPKSVQNAAKKGLELRKRNEERKDLPEDDPDHLASSASLGGTAIGVARAVQLSKGEPITPRAIRRIYSYLERHTPDKKAKGFGDDKRPSAGYVAWLLWGGDAALRWVTKMIKALDKEDESS